MVDDPDRTCQSCGAPAGACRCEGAVAADRLTQQSWAASLDRARTVGAPS